MGQSAATAADGLVTLHDRIAAAKIQNLKEQILARLSSTLRLDSTELAEVRPEGSSPKSKQFIWDLGVII